VIEVTRIEQGGEIIEELRDRIVGRVALEDVKDPLTGEIIVERNDLVDKTRHRRAGRRHRASDPLG
jgi:DNA-directed RNA polymerase subunit beta'